MELLDICGKDGLPTGEQIPRELAHRNGVLHRTAHVWIVRRAAGRWEVLLQKRSLQKDSFPGMYDTSSAGHVPAGGEPLPSALRELEEELGLRAGPASLRFIGHIRTCYEKTFHGSPFRDNEFINIYVYTGPVCAEALHLQASEVEEVRWFGLEEVRDEIRRSRERFCVPAGSLELLHDWLAANDIS